MTLRSKKKEYLSLIDQDKLFLDPELISMAYSFHKEINDDMSKLIAILYSSNIYFSSTNKVKKLLLGDSWDQIRFLLEAIIEKIFDQKKIINSQYTLDIHKRFHELNLSDLPKKSQLLDELLDEQLDNVLKFLNHFFKKINISSWTYNEILLIINFNSSCSLALKNRSLNLATYLTLSDGYNYWIADFFYNNPEIEKAYFDWKRNNV